MAGEGRGCDDAGTSPVEFAYDTFGCCVLSLTREALAEVRAGENQAPTRPLVWVFAMMRISEYSRRDSKSRLRHLASRECP